VGEIERLPQIAGCHAGVLISGETGTGKSCLPRHSRSEPARKLSVVPLNCGAIPASWRRASSSPRARRFHRRARDVSRSDSRGGGGTLFLHE